MRLRFLFAVLTVSACTVCSGGSIDFVVLPPTDTGLVSYAGGSAPLVGGGLTVTEATGQVTPQNDGTPFALGPNTTLSFSTGDFEKALPNGWEFAGGGGITISSASDPLNPYLSGTFSGSVDVIDTGGGLFKVVAGGIVASPRADMAAFYGLAGGQDQGGVSLLFQTDAIPGMAFRSTVVNSGNVAVSPGSGTVPEPGTLLLSAMGIVWAGMILRRRRT
jgi:hypothetical protein